MIVHLPTVIAKSLEVSMSEARRGLAQGAVKIDDEIVNDLDVEIKSDAIVWFGKRRSLAIHV